MITWIIIQQHKTPAGKRTSSLTTYKNFKLEIKIAWIEVMNFSHEEALSKNSHSAEHSTRKSEQTFLATLSLCRAINLASLFTIPMQRAWFFPFSHTHKLPCAPVLFSLLEFRYQFPSSEQQPATLRLIIELIMKDITRIFLLGPSEMGLYMENVEQ